ncbi:hypothetical protein J4450_06505 [Candidatus Micrarchaeota archaeon]|nr:hypothetical protein [Candidatus Micrarchaeota archaeon]
MNGAVVKHLVGPMRGLETRIPSAVLREEIARFLPSVDGAAGQRQRIRLAQAGTIATHVLSLLTSRGEVSDSAVAQIVERFSHEDHSIRREDIQAILRLAALHKRRASEVLTAEADILESVASAISDVATARRTDGVIGSGACNHVG